MKNKIIEIAEGAFKYFKGILFNLKIARLTTKEEFAENFRLGNCTINPNKIYKFKYAKFTSVAPTFVEEISGYNLLKELYYDEYYYLDINTAIFDEKTQTTSCDLVRRPKELDCVVWGKYDELIKTF
jgi:hypothetical protein